MFNQDDYKQFEEKGIDAESVQKQLTTIKDGFPYLQIISPATVRDGIIRLSEEAVLQYSYFVEDKLVGKKIAKFVPASGAASRMFKMLFSALEKCTQPGFDPELLLTDDDGFYSFGFFIKHISSFGFYNDLEIICAVNNTPLRQLINEKDFATLLELLLTEKGLNYGNLPKGLLKFHKYFNFNRTAIEEHLVEGALYAKNSDGRVNIHFTVSEQHLSLFEEHVGSVLEKYEKEYSVKYDISYSVQTPHTDTVAADENFEPFRTSDGGIVFRPAGHGALLENLFDLDADVIFIKNIDNVVPDRMRDATVTYKKTLLSILIEIQTKVKMYVDFVASGQDINEWRLLEIIGFIEKNLGYRFPKGFLTVPEQQQREKMLAVLNRPIRICGMVKNNGEPGGGPFWVAGNDGSQSLQIIEKAQINLDDPAQVKLLNSATHFNPVDLVVCRCSFDGKPLDYKDFVDENAGIVTKKSQNGKDLYALELPGLWNGSMANWNTAFIEVPVATFNPVKEVNDLLRNEHAQTVD